MDALWWQRLHGGSTHLPIVLLPLSVMFDVLALRSGEAIVGRALHRAGLALASAGVLGGAAAVVAGLALTHGTLLGTGGERLHHAFVWPGFAAATGLVAWRFFRHRRIPEPDSKAPPLSPSGVRSPAIWFRVYLFGMITASALMLGAGYSGGEMLLGAEPIAVPPTSRSTTTNELSADVLPGRELFLMNCAHCHGDDARGTDEAPDLTESRKSEARMASVVKNGIKGEMPRFGEKLTDEQVRMLVGFLRSLNQPKA